MVKISQSKQNNDDCSKLDMRISKIRQLVLYAELFGWLSDKQSAEGIISPHILGEVAPLLFSCEKPDVTAFWWGAYYL